MTDRFDIVETEPVTLAAAEAATKQSEIPSRIRAMFDVVYAWLRRSGSEQVGHNYVVYDRFARDGMRMQVGFPVAQRFTSADGVNCVELPGGRAAHTTYVGPYSGLPAVTAQLNAWCAEQSLQLAGVSWEIYGDWNEDESQLVTDLYFRLR